MVDTSQKVAKISQKKPVFKVENHYYHASVPYDNKCKTHEETILGI